MRSETYFEKNTMIFIYRDISINDTHLLLKPTHLNFVPQECADGRETHRNCVTDSGSRGITGENGHTKNDEEEQTTTVNVEVSYRTRSM